MNNLNMLFSVVFLSTLSLRRATYFSGVMRQNPGISIHALLAESDMLGALWVLSTQIFLSTLSLRRATRRSVKLFRQNYISIHALLAESDILPGRLGFLNFHFYPRSPCGERLVKFGMLLLMYPLFLSTLSLRRATAFALSVV